MCRGNFQGVAHVMVNRAHNVRTLFLLMKIRVRIGMRLMYGCSVNWVLEVFFAKHSFIKDCDQIDGAVKAFFDWGKKDILEFPVN